MNRNMSVERLEAYTKAFELRQEGLGPHRISELINVPWPTIGGWFYQGHHPLGSTHQFEIKPSPELSYIIGVYLGDGTAYYNKTSQGYRIVLRVKDRKFAESFSKAIVKVLGKKKPYKITFLKGKFYNVEASSFLLFKFLKQNLDNLREYIKAFPKDFLRGFYESEGSLSIRRYYWNNKGEKRPRQTPQSRMNMCNLNRELLFIAKEVLEQLGFHPTITGPYKSCEIYAVNLSRNKEVKRFMRLVNPCIKRGD